MGKHALQLPRERQIDARPTVIAHGPLRQRLVRIMDTRIASRGDVSTELVDLIRQLARGSA